MLLRRELVFRHYWWLAILIGGTAVGFALNLGGANRMALAASAIVATLGFCYFAQTQKLAETKLFKDLFTEFNRRYDRMNGRLAEIPTELVSTTDAQRKLMVDYFNLCAEEYLFFRDGYIRSDVWRSWCRGMLSYLDKESFKAVWESEISTNSYYGLSLTDIRQGAAQD